MFTFRSFYCDCGFVVELEGIKASIQERTSTTPAGSDWPSNGNNITVLISRNNNNCGRKQS